jgi:hypothetical protein
VKKTKCSLVFSAIILFLILSGFACENGSGSSTVVGSTQGNTDINNVSFTITELEVSSSSLQASGTVKNIGSSSITSPWYVEAQFYEDSTLSLKLGGNKTRIGVPLESGVQTIWSITFSDQNIAEGDYPNFRVSNLRAYYIN